MTGALGLLVAASWIALAPAQASAPPNAWTAHVGHRPLGRPSVAAAVAGTNRQDTSRAVDPVGDGIVRGALIGAGAGVGIVALAYSMCDAGCEAPDAAPVLLLGGGVGAGVGAAIGWLVDAVHKDRPAAARAVSLAPILAPRHKAVAVRLRF